MKFTTNISFLRLTSSFLQTDKGEVSGKKDFPVELEGIIKTVCHRYDSKVCDEVTNDLTAEFKAGCFPGLSLKQILVMPSRSLYPVSWCVFFLFFFLFVCVCLCVSVSVSVSV